MAPAFWNLARLIIFDIKASIVKKKKNSYSLNNLASQNKQEAGVQINFGGTQAP